MTQLERQILQCVEADPLISHHELAARLGITSSAAAESILHLMEQGHIAGRGYVLSSGSYIVVVGGINIDIAGCSFHSLIPEDSNPGRVSVSLGGVGRNIAHNLSLLNQDVRMLTAYGDDSNGQRVGASCSELGIDMRHALIVPGATTSTYLYITNPDGEMALAVSDMRICDCISPDYLSQNIQLLNHAQLVIADANLPQASLEYLAGHITVPLFCDPVSTAKAVKLKNILGRIHTFKPNRLEAELLTGITIINRETAFEAGHRLLDQGMHRVFLSLGAGGVCAATRQGDIWMPSLCHKMVNTTGCGDAFMAGLAWAYLRGSDLQHSTAAGIAAASIAMETCDTISPLMSEGLLRARLSDCLAQR